MNQLPPEVRQRLNAHLSEIRNALRHDPTVDVEDVIAEVEENILLELSSTNEPVRTADLDLVLARLGPPDSWAEPALADDTRATWTSWILPLVCLALFAIAFVVDPTQTPIPIILGFVLARAIYSGLDGDDARRWLLFPSLLALLVPVAIAGMSWPVVLLRNAEPVWRFTGLGAWWIALGALGLRYPRLVPTVFQPFIPRSFVGFARFLIFAGAALVVGAQLFRYVLA